MVRNRSNKRKDEWVRELYGWDDGNVYVFHRKRGNFSIKMHPELEKMLVNMAIKYLEEHNAKSEEELRESDLGERQRKKM
ncbi:MAG: hypothetical protein QXX08_10750 [Candidatus Bathyarchaeia archaeon]